MNALKWTFGLALVACFAGSAFAQSGIQTAFNYDFAAIQEDVAAAPAPAPQYVAQDAMCGCGSACGDPCCNCNCGSGWNLCDCCLGEPCRLRCYLVDDCCCLDFGGWTQLGYHSNNTRLSFDRGDLLAFNDVPNQINLQQQWFWFEKAAEAGPCTWDWGFRFDFVYGTDAQKTQAFGNPGGAWDVTFDNGIYGSAMPQAYVELAHGDWSVIAGHFFTIIGYEVIPAPDNFFYSHALTMFNSEPFTHTGMLATYSGMGDSTLYLGWTMGWDTGFDQFGGGSNWLGGFSTPLNDCVTFTYVSTAGDLGWRSAGGDGYSHSVVVDATVNDCWTYVFQSDYLHADDTGNFTREDFGVNQYLFYKASDCWSFGGRLEWWKSNGLTRRAQSYYEATLGANYRPHANLVLRPEVRYDWTTERGQTNNYNETTFAVDAIFTF